MRNQSKQPTNDQSSYWFHHKRCFKRRQDGRFVLIVCSLQRGLPPRLYRPVNMLIRNRARVPADLYSQGSVLLKCKNDKEVEESRLSKFSLAESLAKLKLTASLWGFLFAVGSNGQRNKRVDGEWGCGANSVRLRSGLHKPAQQLLYTTPVTEEKISEMTFKQIGWE